MLLVFFSSGTLSALPKYCFPILKKFKSGPPLVMPSHINCHTVPSLCHLETRCTFCHRTLVCIIYTELGVVLCFCKFGDHGHFGHTLKWPADANTSRYRASVIKRGRSLPPL